MQKQNLKLIAILLPEPLSHQVRQEQLFIAKTWGPKHVLRTPPHLTIIPPIDVTPDEMESLWTIARKIASSARPFILKFGGYGSFKPRVVYIEPVMVPEFESLYRIWRKEILAIMPHVLTRYPDRPFHPHLTLAHRDVSPEQFKAIWTYYSGKRFSGDMACKSFCLLKHNQDGWEKENEFYFAPGS